MNVLPTNERWVENQNDNFFFILLSREASISFTSNLKPNEIPNNLVLVFFSCPFPLVMVQPI